MDSFDNNLYLWNEDHNFYNLSDTTWQSIATHINADIEPKEGGFEIDQNDCLIIPKGGSLIIRKKGYLIKVRSSTGQESYGLNEITIGSSNAVIKIKEINYGRPLAQSFIYTADNQEKSMSAGVVQIGYHRSDAASMTPVQTEEKSYFTPTGLYYTELNNYTINSRRVRILTNALLPTTDDWVLKNMNTQNPADFQYVFNNADSIATVNGYGHRRWFTENIHMIPLGSSKTIGSFSWTSDHRTITWNKGNNQEDTYVLPTGGKCILLIRNVQTYHGESDYFSTDFSAFSKPAKLDSQGHEIWENSYLLTPILTYNNYRWGRSLDRYANNYDSWSAMSNKDSLFRWLDRNPKQFYDALSEEAKKSTDTTVWDVHCTYGWSEIIKATGNEFHSLQVYENSDPIENDDYGIMQFTTDNPIMFYWHWYEAEKTIQTSIKTKESKCHEFWGIEADEPRSYIEGDIAYNFQFKLHPWTEFYNDANIPDVKISNFTQLASTIRPCDLNKYNNDDTSVSQVIDNLNLTKNSSSMFSLSALYGDLNFSGIKVEKDFFWEWHVGFTKATRAFPVLQKYGQTATASEIQVPWFAKTPENIQDWPGASDTAWGNWWFRDLTNASGDLSMMYPYVIQNGNVSWVTNWFNVKRNNESPYTFGLYWISDQITVEPASSVQGFQYNPDLWPDVSSVWWKDWMKIMPLIDFSNPDSKCYLPLIVSSYTTNTHLKIVVRTDQQPMDFWIKPQKNTKDIWEPQIVQELALTPLQVSCISVPVWEDKETCVYIKDTDQNTLTQYWSSFDRIRAYLVSWEDKYIGLCNRTTSSQDVYVIQNKQTTQKYRNWQLYKASDLTTPISQESEWLTLEPQIEYVLQVDGLGDDIITIYDTNDILINEFVYALKFQPVFPDAEAYCTLGYNAEWSGELQYWNDYEDGGEWVPISKDDTSFNHLFNHQYPLYIRGKGNQYCRSYFNESDWTSNILRGDDPTGVFLFNFDKDQYEYGLEECAVKVDGNVMALLNYQIHDPTQLKLANNALYGLFAQNRWLINAPILLSKQTQLSTGCYRYMFYNCGLFSVPDLPHTTLADYCYQEMFANCQNLRSVPAINTTLFPSGCCHSMFSGAGVRLYQNSTNSNYRLPFKSTFDGTFATDSLTHMFHDLNNQPISTIPIRSWMHIVYQDTNDQWCSAKVVITEGTGNGGSVPNATPF